MTPYVVILLGAAIAFLAWLVQRAVHRADEQRRVASRLRGYLMYWHRFALKMNGGAKFLAIGQTWYEDEQEVHKVGGRRDEIRKKLVEIEYKYQSGVAESAKADLSGKAPFSTSLKDVQAALAKSEKARGELSAHDVARLRRSRSGYCLA